MRPEAPSRQAVSLGGALTAVLVAALLFHAPVARALELYLVGLAALGVGLLAARGLRDRELDEGPPLPLAAWWRQRRRPRHADRLRQLEAIEHAAAFSLSTAFDVHYRLRPHLVTIAQHRLGARGMRLDDAAERLGPQLWDVVRPDRPAPEDRHAKGIDFGQLRDMVGRLAAL